jgi:hypothetical protein
MLNTVLLLVFYEGLIMLLFVIVFVTYLNFMLRIVNFYYYISKKLHLVFYKTEGIDKNYKSDISVTINDQKFKHFDYKKLSAFDKLRKYKVDFDISYDKENKI